MRLRDALSPETCRLRSDCVAAPRAMPSMAFAGEETTRRSGPWPSSPDAG